jgi:hypothetical protein
MTTPGHTDDVATTTGLLTSVPWRSFEFASPRYRPDATYLDIAGDKLRRACRALGLPAAEITGVLGLAAELCEPWGREPVGVAPGHPSYFASDGMPLELALAFDAAGHEVRLSVEVPGHEPTPRSRQAAGARLTRALASRHNASIDRYLSVEDIFVTPDPRGFFAMVHGFTWRPGAAPVHKVYLDPRSGGPGGAQDAVLAAMSRLGMATAWQAVVDHVDGLVPRCFSLDLSASPDARVKVYFGHPGVDAAEIDRRSAVVPGHQPGRFERVLQHLTGRRVAGWSVPPGTCYTFRAGHDRPTSVALYMTLIPELANDEAVRYRVAGLLRDEGIRPAPYLSAAEALADGPAALSRTQHCLAYHSGRVPRVSVYVAPGIFAATGAGEPS